MAAADGLVVLKRGSHRDQIVCHRDDGKEKDEKESKSYEGGPGVLRVPETSRSRPEDDENERDGQPQEIE